MRNLSKLTDEELISLFIGGNNAAFDIILNRYESKVYSYIFYILRNSEIAEDFFQDVFTHLIQMLRSGLYEENGKFSNFIMRMTHNLIIDYLRKKKVRAGLCVENYENEALSEIRLATDKTAEDEIMASQTYSNLRRLIDMLPENQRVIVQMRYYEDLPFKEIAKILNISINTALGRMRYAINNLRSLAAKNNIDICLAS